MQQDVIVIGAGLSGLTAAALLAKRGQKVLVLDAAYCPGGTCGAFKRDGAVFDQGAAMLFGFGEQGFAPHRFVFNALEQPIDVIRHKSMYRMQYEGRWIEFYPDIPRFVAQLAEIFPEEEKALHRFYADFTKLYTHVIAEYPSYTTPDESDPKAMMPGIKAHPRSYIKFLSFMNRDTASVLKKYFRSKRLLDFFDKLTSTYCYTPAAETPAILAAVMFIDNHVGGSFYPAGGTHMLPGRLEKVIEENGGAMRPRVVVDKILFEGGKPCGVKLHTGEELFARDIVYSGTVWNLYEKLLPRQELPGQKLAWARSLIPTLPNVVAYLKVDEAVIPRDTLPTEMLAGLPGRLEDSELTLYIPTIDDKTLCEPGSHLLTVIGPTYEEWDRLEGKAYEGQKRMVMKRLLEVLEKRFPGIEGALQYSELATPRTVERFTRKNGGAAAGPKQSLGQHMFKRQHIRTTWDSLYCCGESTTMGTGTTTVTISGIAAANAVLKKRGLEPYIYQEDMQNYVRVVEPGYTREQQLAGYTDDEQALARQAMRCQFCQNPSCTYGGHTPDIPGLMRRIVVGNFTGAFKLAERIDAPPAGRCILEAKGKKPVQVGEILQALKQSKAP